MGNTCATPQYSVEQSVRHLLKRRSSGDPQLIKCIRSSPSGECAKGRLEGYAATLRHNWDLVKSMAGNASWFCMESSHGAEGPDAPARLWRKLLDVCNEMGECPLFVACQMGYTEAVEYLLEQGASPWPADRRGGRTCLHIACLGGQNEVVKVLLEQHGHHVSPQTYVRYLDSTTISGFAPLHCAAASGDGPTLATVLSFRPNFTASSAYNSLEFGLEYPAQTTVLHVAASQGSQIIAKLLLHYHHATAVHTIDPRLARDSKGELPWQVAYRKRHRVVAEILVPSFPLSLLFEFEHVAMVTLQSLATEALKNHLLASLAKTEQHLKQQPLQCTPSQQHTVASSSGRHVPLTLPASPCSTRMPTQQPSMLVLDFTVNLNPGMGLPGASTAGPVSSFAVSSIKPSLVTPFASVVCEDVPWSHEMQLDGPATLAKGSSKNHSRRSAPVCRTDSMREEEKVAYGNAGAMLKHHRSSHRMSNSVMSQGSRPKLMQISCGGAQASLPQAVGLDAVCLAAPARKNKRLQRQYSLCNICMEEDSRVGMEPCNHQMCVGCARLLVGSMKVGKPVDCPYCRRYIKEFNPVV